MDISDTLAPKSDQLDAVDLLGSPPRIFTVERVSKGSAEQPVQIHLAEFPRPWRPGVTMRRVLAHCWGNDASKWTGHRAELYCDEKVVFGGEVVGGVRVSRLSHIDGPKSVPVILKKGRGGSYKVAPLPDAPAPQQADPLKEAKNRLWQAWLAAGNAHSGDALTAEYEQWAAAPVDEATVEQLDTFAATLTPGVPVDEEPPVDEEGA